MFKYGWCSIALLIVCLLALCSYAQTSSSKIDSLKQLVKNAKADTDKVKAMIAVSELTKCADTTQRKAYALDALQLAEKIEWENGMMRACIAAGETYDRCIKNYEASCNYYLQADSIAKSEGDKLKHAAILNKIAMVYQNNALYGKALEYYRTVVALNTGPDEDISALGNMGVIYNHLGDLPKSIACYDSSLKKLDHSINTSKRSDAADTMEMAGLFIQMGDIYRAMKQYDKAFANYNNALRLAEQIKQDFLRITSTIGIASTYKQQDNFNDAIAYYNKALDVCRKADDKQSETQILNYLSNLYVAKGAVDDAAVCAQSALHLATENNFTDFVPSIYSTLGKVCTKQKDYGKAVEFLKKAIALSNRSGDLYIQRDATEAISHTYEEMKQPALAFEAYRQYIAIRDSMYNIDKANELTRIDLRSDYERKQTADSIAQAADYKLKIQKQVAFTYSGFAGLVVVLLLAFFIYRNYAQQKKANVAISAEKEVSESLLLNILPEEVAKELKEKGNVDAKLFEEVTVLFTDFVNFTEAAERFTPKELVAELHTCFKAFDDIIGKYGIEKIKTVGDAYMAVSGLPEPNTSHAVNMVHAALELRDFMTARNREVGVKTFHMRIGVNSGTVVAGIVGVKKFAYDIWGDTVNLAARMEQNGIAEKVNISQTTYELVKDHFACEDRGQVQAKNKGGIRMYFVEAKG